MTRVFERPVAARTEAESEVVVPFWAVKFWRVVEPLTRRLANVLKVEEKLPIEPILEKRLVDEAFVAKKFVVVALVLVASTRVRL